MELKILKQKSTLVDEDAWDSLMNTNVRAAMMCFKYAAQQMIKQGRGGSIIGEKYENFPEPFQSC